MYLPPDVIIFGILLIIGLVVSVIYFRTKKKRVEKFLEKILEFIKDAVHGV